MTDNEIIKALDVLAKFDFFGGQRAGRELWNEKPTDVQDKDIESFSKDVAFLKDFINRQKAEIERLEADLKVKNQVLKDRELTPYPFDDDHERRTSYLHLVNRQQAEIVKLEAETDRLNYILQCYALEHGTVGDKERVLKEARDEAVKEFAKRVKEYPIECRLPLFGLPTKQDVEEYFDSVMMNVGKAIDNVAKELTEGKADEDK